MKDDMKTKYELKTLDSEKLDKVSGGQHPPMSEMQPVYYTVVGDIPTHDLTLKLEWSMADLCKWNPHLLSCINEEDYVVSGTVILYYE